jgi:hypothetical protein
MVPCRAGVPRRRTLKGKLNLFQATMLRWRDLHPYNAVHAVALAPQIDAATVERASADELTHCGLTGLAVDRQRGRYEYRGGPARVRVAVTRGERVLDALAQVIEVELNAPFADPPQLDPFRFFLVEAPDGRMLGLAYDHFVASGDCIMALLHAIVERSHGRPSTAPRPLLYPPTQSALFAHNLPRLLIGLARLPALIRSARRTARPRYHDVMDGHNGYALYALTAAQYRRLTSAAKRASVTQNDILLALLLLALDPFAPHRQRAPRRRELAVASIMNLRGEFGDAGQAAFGQFLGSLRVSHPVPSGVTLEALARDVHAATSQVKREKLYLQTLLAMRYVAGAWRMLAPAQRAGFYAKSYPIWAGLSALNVNALWPRDDPSTAPPLYIRGVPTGPIAPLVLAVTTVGDILYAGVSYRTAAFARHDVDRLWSGLTRRLDELP